MKKVICYTKFKLDPFGDGGSKRSAQIRQLMADNGIVYEDDAFALPKDIPMFQLVRWTFRSIWFIQKHYPKSQIESLSAYIQLVKYYALRIPVVYDKYLHQDVVFLWENTNDRDMLYLLKATEHTIIGMPHNLESLVVDHSVDTMEEEVHNLQHCDIVYAISKEESWLLRVLGVNARFFPYFPPKQVEERLFSIRKRREGRRVNLRKKYLLLGSVSNYPTRAGMQALLNFAESKPLPFDLCIAGYGTESLSVPKHSGFCFLGTVTNEALDGILEETDAVLIYQPPTTGALTRIPEMLLAGVPVFVNFDAARSFWNINGVHFYESFEDLFVALENYVPYQPEILTRDILFEKQFISTMNNACV